MQRRCRMCHPECTSSDKTEVLYGAISLLISTIEDLTDFLESSGKQPIEDQCKQEVVDIAAEQDNNDVLDLNLSWMGEAKPNVSRSTIVADSLLSPVSARAILSENSAVTFLVPGHVVKCNVPFARFVNLVLQGLQPGQGRTGCLATVLLENPVGYNTLSFEALMYNVQCVFGLRGVQIRLFHDSQLKQELGDDINVQHLTQRTIFVAPQVLNGAAPPAAVAVRWPFCNYVNVQSAARKGVILMENPRGDLLTLSEVLAETSHVLSMPTKDIHFLQIKTTPGTIKYEGEPYLPSLYGETIFV